jgi:hypothetical protein
VSSTGTPRSDTRWLVAILAIGLLVRLVWGLSRPTDDAAIAVLPDQRGYLDLARNLLQGAGLHYVDERFGPTADGKPAGQTVYAARTPGYPVFVAMCGGSVRTVRVAQALLDTSTALAVYLLARRFLRSPVGPPLAGALVAFNPFLVYFSALLLTETLYTSMLAWGMVLLLLARGRAWVWGVLLLVLAIHVRPSGIGLPVVLAACAPFARGHDRAAGSLKRPVTWIARALVPPVAAVALTLAVLLPWAWRNDRVLGRWLWSTSNDGITLYDGFHPGATGASDQSFVTRMPHVRDMGELERSNYFRDAAKGIMWDDAGRFSELALAKVARTWSPVPLSAEFGRPLYKAVALLFALPFDVLVVAGIFAGRLPRAALVYLLLPALYFTAVHALSVGSLRYRVPAEAPLAVLAAAGAARVIGREKADGG